VSAYQVLYRRFRPKTFEDIIGQGSIVAILKNQIKMGMVSHAYLFCGSRGTGKTSTAKVFARAANCLNPKNGEACGHCAYCENYKEDGYSDIIEIDAASNRGIDEVRELRDKISLMPSLGRYRVYIIDEVHMLTTEAFNALLKTLEEPPSHVIFIFATTEPAKVPATILSRCQRFDFARVSRQELTARMRYVLGEIGAEADDAALNFIAENSDGAVRDALGYLDKAVAIAGGRPIDVAIAESSMGVASPQAIIDICLAVCKADTQAALEALDRAIGAGIDVFALISQLIEYFRSLLIFITVSEPEKILTKSEAEMASYEEARIHVSVLRLVTFIKELSRARSDARVLSYPRYLLEALLASMSDKLTSLPSESLAARVDRLERVLETALSAGRLSASAPPARAAQAEAAPVKAEEAPSGAESPALPAGEADAGDGVDWRKEIAHAAKYILNKDRNILLSNLFEKLEVKSYKAGTLTLAPTGTAVSMMDSFEGRGGAAKLEEILTEHSGVRVRVEVIAPEAAKEKADEGILQSAMRVFGQLTEFNDD